MSAIGPDPNAQDSLDLPATLDLLAQTIVNALGFDVAVVNLVRADGSLEVVSCAGPTEVREQLVGQTDSQENWETVLEGSQEWGRLRFLDHKEAQFDPNERLLWVPAMDVLDEPDAWHPEDALFAPLYASDGSMLGILSVDMPRNGRRPDEVTRDALEAFAVSAAMAIEHATLRSRTEDSERLFRGVFNASPLGMALLDDAGAMRVVNDAMCSILGRTVEQLTGSSLDTFTHPHDRKPAKVSSQLAQRPSARLEQRYVRPDGSLVWGELTVTAIGAPQRTVVQVRDVTTQREAVGRLRHLASHDPVTGVGNRSLLLERLLAAVERRDNGGVPITLMFVDLDGFKRINDAHSHSVGDQVLRAVARNLTGISRPQDTVARWGGDEFVVLAEDIPDETAAVEFAGRIERAVAQPLRISDDDFRVTASIGLAFSVSGDIGDAEGLLHDADSAMYESKRRSAGAVSVFDASLRVAAERRAHIEEVLRTAVEQSRLVLHYQPILALHDGKVATVEALLRLCDDDGTLLHPGQFIESAEELDLLVGIEHAALREACEQAKEWENAGMSMGLSVNVSVRHLADIDTFEATLHRILAETGVSADKLTCEITEHAYLDANPPILEGMRRLTAAGVNFSVDDFGTGFGSMTYLRSMPIQEIKIDRSFVAHAPTERAAAAIVRAHAILAKELGVRCVAEGVETAEQHALVTSVGVGLAQGFLYQRPVLPAELTEQLVQHPDGFDLELLQTS